MSYPSFSVHTPGPWRAFGPYDNGFLNSGYLIVTDADDGPIEPEAGIFDNAQPIHGPMTGFTEADAKLIAAAPDLLTACKAALQFITNGIEMGYISWPVDDIDPASKTPELLSATIAKAAPSGEQA